MRYELFLRGAGAAARDDGLLDGGLDGLQVDHVYGPDGARLGFDVSLDPDQPGATGELLCARAFALAESAGLEVYDPQLGRNVGREDTADICERVARTGDYVRSLRLGSVRAPHTTRRPGALLLVLLALAIGLVALAGRLSRCLT